MTAMERRPRPLRIALVAPIWLPVPPATYGGTERVVALLDKHYRAAGHEVVLFATGDSTTAGELRSVTDRGLVQHMAQLEAWEYEHHANALAADVVADSGSFDLIHSHLGLAQLPILNLASCPVVQTVHAPLGLDDVWNVQRCPNTTLVTLTKAQAEPLESVSASSPSATVISSGLDMSRFEPSTDGGDTLVFLGRMGRQKNPVGAIEIARAAGWPLVLAGAPQNAEEHQYFDQQVAPLVDGDAVRYLGPVDHEAKQQLLAQAAALVFPIVDNEAFGLVMVEAMACGTPVLGRRHSSVPEIIDPGVTGFVGNEVADMVDLVPATVALDRGEVRARAEKRFGHERMGDDYLALFDAVVRQ